MIYEVAKIINRLGIETTGLRMIKGTSEMIIDAYQAEAQRAFGQKIISEYGAAEAGLIAFECPSGSMHINVEDVVLEVGEDGEAIVTNLASYSFPIIRYRLGDTVTVSPNPCSCGRQHPVLTEVIGRRGGTVVGRQTRYPALTFYYVFKNLAIEKGLLLNYRVVQVEPGHCVLMVEGAATHQLEARIMEELHKYFQSDVDFDLRFLSELPRGGRKAQYFESQIP
jgi:phenylacetate-CoA ligase